MERDLVSTELKFDHLQPPTQWLLWRTS
jgi:hypothetical protein